MLVRAGQDPMDPLITLDYADFEKVGWLILTQLAELRHRGAFSTVAHTFALCCIKCVQSKDEATEQLPRVWYKVSCRVRRLAIGQSD